MLSILTIIGGKVAICVLAGSAIVVGGTGAAAYADLLPAAAQRVAHEAIGAPLPRADGPADPTETADPADPADPQRPTATPPAKRVGPDAKQRAAHGLCTAFTHGGLAVSSTAYATLVHDANGASNIETYCASLPKPGPHAAHGPGSGDRDKAPHSPEPRPTDQPSPGSNDQPGSDSTDQPAPDPHS